MVVADAVKIVCRIQWYNFRIPSLFDIAYQHRKHLWISKLIFTYIYVEMYAKNMQRARRTKLLTFAPTHE